MGAGSSINGDGILEPTEKIGTPIAAVGCLKGTDDIYTFAKSHYYHPAAPVRGLDDIKDLFPADSNINFYFPTIPVPARCDMGIELLKHFTKAVVLFEKPSHNTAQETIDFLARIKEHGFENRIMCAYHSSTHPTRKILLETVKQKAAEIGIKHIYIDYDFPKDPNNPRNARMYNPATGGAMRDLGVYCYTLMDEIARDQNASLNEGKILKAEIDSSENGVDIGSKVTVEFKDAKGRSFTAQMNTKINAGCHDVKVAQIHLLNGEVITQHSYCHQHLSNGVFIESAKGGKATLIPNSVDNETTSYRSQI